MHSKHIMKWRLSSDGSHQKEIPNHKSMSYSINNHSNSSNDPKNSNNHPTINTLDQKFKPRPSNNGSAVDQQNDPHDHKYRLCQEEAFKVSNETEKHGSNGNIFVISSNQTRQSESVPWTTTTAEQAMSNITAGRPTNDSNLSAMILDNYTDETNNEFHYVNTNTNPSSRGSLNKNGSTAKLLPITDDQSSPQSKCSIFRGLLLCLCLNITYSNIVRFPRELDRHGSQFLIPYFILLLLVGLPIILLEVSIGQFLGQGSAHSWRASPLFKGASIVSRLATWLGGIWVSLQAVLAVVYVGMLIFKTVPFSECVGGVKIIKTGYTEDGRSGQECIQKTFLTPVWENAFFFTLLTFGLIFLWMIVMGFTHSAKVLRRSVFSLGLIGFALLLALTGWEVHNSLNQQYFPEIWPFDETMFANSNLWFNALVQVIYSTNIGMGIIPVITGKFLYKSDAVRTSIVYLCFNLLINAIAVTLFMVQFDHAVERNATLPELKPLTGIYDAALIEKSFITGRIVPGLIYSLIVISSVITMSVAIFTSSRIIPRHPNYLLSLVALVFATAGLVAPEYIAARVFDTRIVPTLIISSLVFDLIATTWVYGAKNIYTDLEFSIGRPILKSWLILWCFASIILTGVLVWWCVGDDNFDLLNIYIPRWAPILFVLAIILVIACIEIFKQVDYNFFGMICEAAKPAKEWGPADPLARHAWKQWRSVCQDTGQKDFTLRRRGTRDYTHSIKRGQYSIAKYGTQNWKSSTPGNSSPNYSGSVFGDSAIEEDMSVDKYSGVNQQYGIYSNDGSIRQMRYSNRSRNNISNDKPRSLSADKHKEIVYIRRLSNESNTTKIEITPATDSPIFTARNPLAKGPRNLQSNRYTVQKDNPPLKCSHPDHINWRKFSVNSEEYSTEL